MGGMGSKEPTDTQMIDAKIAEKKVMVFSKSYCPYCAKAKKEFNKLIKEGKLAKTDYEVMEIENRNDCDAIQDYLHSITGARSVPRVFINGKCIGGGDETAAAARSGELVKMVA